MSTDNSGNGGAFLAGLALAGIPALVHNAAKNERHTKELNDSFYNGYLKGLHEAAIDLQKANQALCRARQERDQRLQEIQRLRSENEVLKAIVHEQPASVQTEAVLKALQRVEFRLTELLPPQFQQGGNGQDKN